MADKGNTFLGANSIYEDVEGETGKKLKLKDDQKVNLVGIINSRFTEAENSRKQDESRWLTSYENYKGNYNRSVRFRDSEKSRVFV